MSLAVKQALLDSHDLGKNERLVLLTLAAHANLKSGDARPSVRTIARYIGCSERTVQRALAKLVQLGRVVVRKVAGIAEKVYRLIAGQPQQGASNQPARVTNSEAGVPNPASGGDSHGCHPKLEEGEEEKTHVRAGGRLNWRRYIPQRDSNPDSQRRPSYPERRGAALPPDRRTDQCPTHLGQPAHNCAPCRSEALGGVR